MADIFREPTLSSTRERRCAQCLAIRLPEVSALSALGLSFFDFFVAAYLPLFAFLVASHFVGIHWAIGGPNVVAL